MLLTVVSDSFINYMSQILPIFCGILYNFCIKNMLLLRNDNFERNLFC